MASNSSKSSWKLVVGGYGENSAQERPRPGTESPGPFIGWSAEVPLQRDGQTLIVTSSAFDD